MSELLKSYAAAIEGRSEALVALTHEDKVMAAEAVVRQLESLVRRYGVELKRVIKARRAAMSAELAEALRPVGTPLGRCPKCGGLKRKMPVPALGIKCSDPWHDDPMPGFLRDVEDAQ